MDEINILKNGDGWVQFVFTDDTRMTVHSTLNKGVLKSVGASLMVGHLFDLERLKYVSFRKNVVNIIVTEKKPIWEDEVLQFANRFI